MSDDETSAIPRHKPSTDAIPFERPKYRSWRKKYRKMKARFDDVMRHNSNMFKEEQKLDALAKRLQAQNDQLLDLLLDLNASLDLPPDQRYNLKLTPDWTDREAVDLPRANTILAEARDFETQGRYTHAQYAQIRATLESHIAGAEATGLAELERAVGAVVGVADGEVEDGWTGYLDGEDEEGYLERLDVKLGDMTASVRQASPLAWAALSAREAEREVELRNPLSVHNWLKKHNVNIADGDERSEAGGQNGKKGGGRGLAKKMGDRAVERARGERDEGSPGSSAAGARGEGEYEEEGVEDGPRRRKSRDADETYRPKGGRSGKAKRKREDVDVRGAGKKPRTSMAGLIDA